MDSEEESVKIKHRQWMKWIFNELPFEADFQSPSYSSTSLSLILLWNMILPESA